MKVSILLLTHNEAENLSRCLDVLRWCDDIAIVDSGSTDGTLEVAQKYNARILQRPFDSFASQRNFGLAEANFRYEWVLHLDADELATPAFVACLLSLEPKDGIDAYFIPSKIIFFDHWIKHAGMYPAYQVRLGRVGSLRFKQVGHGQREDLSASRIGIFDEPYLHFAFSHGFRRWLEKHVVYASAEAEELVVARRTATRHFGDLLSNDSIMRRRAAKHLSSLMPLVLRPFLRFAYIYIFRGGFLDGAAGLSYACMLAVYEANVAILAYELLKSNNATKPP